MSGYVYVKIDQRCDSSYYEDREYGDWKESWTNTFDSVRLEDSFGFDKEPVDFEPKRGDIVYVVWAEYSTGNSFGYSTSGRIDIVQVFKDKNLAWECYRACKARTDNNKCDYRVKFVTETGKEMSHYVPWLGYFENLEALDVTEAIIE